VAQLAIPESTRVIAAASYDYAAVIEALIAKREAGVLGGENLPLNFANGGFVFKYNEAVGPVLTKEMRAKTDAALASLKAGTLPIDWKSVKY
jgi:basic membrane protein A and related proteins